MATQAPSKPSAPDLLTRLQTLANYVGGRRQIEADLATLAADAAGLFAAEACSILIFKDDPRKGDLRFRLAARSHPLPAGVAADDPGMGAGLAAQVVAQGEALLIEDMSRSQHAALGRSGAGSCICAPLLVARRIRGVLNLSRTHAFGQEDLILARHTALLLAMGLELEHMQGLIRSRFAHRAMASELASHPEMDAAQLGADPKRMARILGKTFFRELRGAGYGSDHILTAATEVIGELGRDIGKGKGAPRRK